MFKSFVDILFILLCGTLVMLSRSIQMGTLDTAPAQLGGGGISEVQADQVVLVAVHPETVAVADPQENEHQTFADCQEAFTQLKAYDCVLLVGGTPEIPHQRVMDCWEACQKMGLNVKLGVAPRETKAED